MKNVQVTLVGEQPGGAIQGLRVPPPFDHLVVLFGDTEKSQKAASEVETVCKMLLPEDKVELLKVDPFKLDNVLSGVLSVRKTNPDAAISINISGGTNIMASAALLGGFITGANVFYIKFKKEDDRRPLEDRVITLPIPKVMLGDVKGTKLEILKALLGARNEPSTMTSKQISSILKISPQLTSSHMKKLEEWRLVVVMSKGLFKYVTLTEIGRLFAQVSK